MLRQLERWIFRRLNGDAGTNYGYRPGVVFDSACRASISRSLYYSWRLRGRVLVDRHAHLKVARDATVVLRSGSILVIGVEPARRATTFEVLPRARVEFLGSVTLMGGSYVRVSHDARLSVGDRSYLNSGSRVVCSEKISVGSDCAISWNVTITDTDAHTLRRSVAEGSSNKPVTIGDHVWVGANSTVLKGIDLGPGAVVAAGSVVTRSVAEATLVAGNPAKVIDSAVAWDI